MKNAVVVIIILVVLGLIFVRFLYISKKTDTKSTLPTNSFTQVKPIEKSAVKNDLTIIESNKIYDIGDNEPVITAVLNEFTALKARYPFLKKAYKGDVVITTPKQTVIFDPLTKTVRDISKVSLYEELSHYK